MISIRIRISNWDEIVAYREEAAKKSDFERSELAKDKTGVEIKGLKAVNPGKRKRNSHLGFRLCTDELWYWCNHGSSGS